MRSTNKAQNGKLEATIAHKQAVHKVERELFRQDRLAYEDNLAKARELLSDNPLWLEATRFIEAFTLLDVHPSFALQSWTWIRVRGDLPGVSQTP